MGIAYLNYSILKLWGPFYILFFFLIIHDNSLLNFCHISGTVLSVSHLLLNTYNSSIKQGFLFPFSKFRKWDSGKFSDLAKVTQLVCSRAKIQSLTPLALNAMYHQLVQAHLCLSGVAQRVPPQGIFVFRCQTSVIQARGPQPLVPSTSCRISNSISLKCSIKVTCVNHPETTPTTSQSVKKSSSTKPVTRPKRLGTTVPGRLFSILSPTILSEAQFLVKRGS